MNMKRITAITAIIGVLSLTLSPLAIASGTKRSVDEEIEYASALTDTDPEKAISLTDSIRRHNRTNNAQQAALLIVEGNAWFSKGDTSKGISRLREALAASRRAGDHRLEIQALGDLGVMLRVAQKPDSALSCYTEALDIMHHHGADPDDEAHILISTAILYTNTGRISDAVPFARKAVVCAEKSDNIEVMMYVGSQAGLILYKSGLKKEGIDIEKRIVSMAENKGIPRYALKAYTSIIDMYHHNGQNDSVAAYMEKGNRLLPLLPEGSVESIGFLEESYILLADMGRFRESLDIQKRILNHKDAGTYMPLDRLWLRVARNYRSLGETANMADAYERSIAISDSLRNSDIDRELSEFNVKYETLQKDLTISRLESQRDRNRLWMTVWIALAFLTMIAAGTFIILRRRREAVEKIRAQLKGIEEERARLARELHDGVCNDLYGVSLLMQTNNADISEITDSVKRIREDVRYISHELMPPRFGDTDLDELLRVYAARSKGFFRYSSQGTPSLPKETAYEVYRIIQELCANIMSHSGAQSAEISAMYDTSGTTMELRYKPSARHNDATNRVSGIGLATVKRRAGLIHAAIETQEENDGTVVTIKI